MGDVVVDGFSRCWPAEDIPIRERCGVALPELKVVRLQNKATPKTKQRWRKRVVDRGKWNMITAGAVHQDMN